MCSKVKMLVTQSHLTICNSMGYNPLGSSVHGILQARILGGLPCLSPGDLPNPGIKPRTPALQVDSLPPETPGKLKCAIPIFKLLFNITIRISNICSVFTQNTDRTHTRSEYVCFLLSKI